MSDVGRGGVSKGGVRPWRMVVIAIAWGSCFPLLDWGLDGVSTLWFVTWRAIVAGLVLWALGAAVNWTPGAPSPQMRLGTWALIGVLALMNVTVSFAAMATSSTGIATGMATVLANSQALLVVLPAWALFGERPRTAEIAAVVFGVGGLLIIAVPSGGGQGYGLALLAAVGVTAGALLARRLTDVDVLKLGYWQFLVGGAALAVLAGVIDGPPTVGMSARSWVALSVLAVGGTALPYLLWFVELRRASITAVTSWTLLVPVVGLALGVVVVGERVALAELLGAATVVTALAIVAVAGRITTRPQHIRGDG